MKRHHRTVASVERRNETMTKSEFITRRTIILSDLLDNPDRYGIYRTTEAYAKLDDLFDKMSPLKQELSRAQKFYTVAL